MVETRRDEVVKLREIGLTYAKIGLRFGITAERVRQILKVLIPRGNTKSLPHWPPGRQKV